MPGEIIIVRSLAESDLGLFAAHRASATSKQRAIQINSGVVQRLLTEEARAKASCMLKCTLSFCGVHEIRPRPLQKSHKNWRLGGPRVEGGVFGQLDSLDFMLLRSIAPNDGSSAITISFISKAVDQALHAGIASIVGDLLESSMTVVASDSPSFAALSAHCGTPASPPRLPGMATPPASVQEPPSPAPTASRSVRQKLREPHILERMLKVSADLSAPARARFLELVEELATQLRTLLVHTGGIRTIPKDHAALWRSVAGRKVGFVDGGLANLAMFGSAPIAARVGGYIVTPGDRSPERERFIMLKQMIDELYAQPGDDAVYAESFPDLGALRDAARIAIEAAGALEIIKQEPGLAHLLIHGALVNPVSRYSDIMQDGRVLYRFPDFTEAALDTLLPAGRKSALTARRDFIAVNQLQLLALEASGAPVCGVIERESSSTTVLRAVVDGFEDHAIQDLLSQPAGVWRNWFKRMAIPEDEVDGQRVTDALLFRCVLEPGEALVPLAIDRNEARRRPEARFQEIGSYPVPQVSYMQVSEWSPPLRLEIFRSSRDRFGEVAALVMHCALLLPRYAFPVGLDVVDKYARIPNWMATPINTQTTVRAMKLAMDKGDQTLFDSLRRMLCGSGREWLLRPGIHR